LRDAAAGTTAAACTDSDTTSNSNDMKKQVRLRFLMRPIEFLPHPSDPSRLGSILCERTELKGEPGKQTAVPTGEFREIPAAMALISVGYKGIPLPDMPPSMFDERRGIIHNHHGKVITTDIGNENDSDGDGGAMIGRNQLNDSGQLYVCGWLKRGPSGIIGTNIADAKDTVAAIMNDLKKKNEPQRKGISAIIDKNDVDDTISSRYSRGREGLDQFLEGSGVEAVDWDGYLTIDKHEKDLSRRRTEAQPREKFTSTADMMALLQTCKVEWKSSVP